MVYVIMYHIFWPALLLSWLLIWLCLTQAPDYLFWKFLQLTDPDIISFSLASLIKLHQGENKGELYGHLLRAQVTAVHEVLFERLRGQGSVDIAKKFIPDNLRFPDFQQKKWSLELYGHMKSS